MTAPTLIDGALDADIADWLEARLSQALAGRQGSVPIALPGGSTPFPIIGLLRGRGIDWSRVVAYPTDDRLVAESHEASNTGKLRALLEPLGAEVVALEEGQELPEFALVWLGLGADGHVASLFPNTDPRPDDPLATRRLTPDPLPPEAPFDRITMTIPALLHSQEILLVMRGSQKRAVLDDAIAGRSDLPVARLLAASHQPVTCFT